MESPKKVNSISLTSDLELLSLQKRTKLSQTALKAHQNRIQPLQERLERRNLQVEGKAMLVGTKSSQLDKTKVTPISGVLSPKTVALPAVAIQKSSVLPLIPEGSSSKEAMVSGMAIRTIPTSVQQDKPTLVLPPIGPPGPLIQRTTIGNLTKKKWLNKTIFLSDGVFDYLSISEDEFLASIVRNGNKFHNIPYKLRTGLNPTCEEDIEFINHLFELRKTFPILVLSERVFSQLGADRCALGLGDYTNPKYDKIHICIFDIQPAIVGTSCTLKALRKFLELLGYDADPFIYHLRGDPSPLPQLDGGYDRYDDDEFSAFLVSIGLGPLPQSMRIAKELREEEYLERNLESPRGMVPYLYGLPRSNRAALRGEKLDLFAPSPARIYITRSYLRYVEKIKNLIITLSRVVIQGRTTDFGSADPQIVRQFRRQLMSVVHTFNPVGRHSTRGKWVDYKTARRREGHSLSFLDHAAYTWYSPLRREISRLLRVTSGI